MDPSNLTEWLRLLASDGWMLYFFGDRKTPHTIAATHALYGYVDTVILRWDGPSCAFRAYLDDADDPLAPTRIVWYHLGDTDGVLREAQTVAYPDAGAEPYPLPESCQIPPGQRQPLTIQPWKG